MILLKFFKKFYSVLILISKKKFIHSLFIFFNGENRRYEYDLFESSIVIDGGGYNGDFSKKISELYGSKIFIFEPYEYYYQRLKKLFNDNKNIYVSNYAISNKSKKVYLVKSGDETFITENHYSKTIIDTISIVSFVKDNDIQRVDLIKLNVEGEEYSILEDILESNICDKFLNLQIQFHKSYQNKKRYNEIRIKLKKKYKLAWRYPWVWESWKLIDEQN